jgi:hypothetical protein
MVRVAVVGLMLASLVACGVRTRHRVTLQNAGNPETVACVRQCRSSHPNTGDDFAKCVDECPNVETKAGEDCDEWDVSWLVPIEDVSQKSSPSVAWCGTTYEANTGKTVGAVAGVLVSLVALWAVLALLKTGGL